MPSSQLSGQLAPQQTPRNGIEFCRCKLSLAAVNAALNRWEKCSSSDLAYTQVGAAVIGAATSHRPHIT
jgi:hypothetical protein